jgi:septal ring factor EnvC (AmiA/AmiB activator)
MLKTLLFCALLSLFFSVLPVYAQDISQNMENGSEQSNNLKTSEQVLKQVYDILSQNENDWNNLNQSINSLNQITIDNSQLLTDSETILKLSEEERKRLADSLNNTLIKEPQKTKKPHRELYLICGVFLGLIIGVACF